MGYGCQRQKDRRLSLWVFHSIDIVLHVFFFLYVGSSYLRPTNP